MTKAIKITITLIIVCGFVYIYWLPFTRPELTQQQLLIEFWPQYLGMFILILVGWVLWISLEKITNAD